MKAIILAAGMGTRLGKYTKNIPKGMVEFNGKSLIERQIEILRSVGINEIIIVKGYMPEKISFNGVKYYINEEYAKTNMVETLMKAESEMNDDVIVCYSDIVFEKDVLNKIIDSDVDIGVTVDKDYLDYWKARLDNWEDDMESLIIDKEGKIVDLGNTDCELGEAKVRYVGLIKFSKEGVEILKKVYHDNKEKYYDKDERWLRSKSFKQGYMTCMIQAIINAGYRVDPIIISHGWMEFDTVEDYEKAVDWIKTGKIKKFINL